MIKITNKFGLPTSMELWLSRDTYDYDSRPNVFSASSLAKPPKKEQLSRKVSRDPNTIIEIDVMDFVGRRRGTAIHDSIEAAVDATACDEHNIMQEVRLEYELDVDGIPFIITGKFDAIEGNILKDWKTESVYSWGDAKKTLDRQHQLSVYMWLCVMNGIPVSQHVAEFVHIFNDFSKSTRKLYEQRDMESKYPPHPITPVRISLLSMADTEAYMRDRIRAHTDKDFEPNSVMCSREDLWLKPAVWQYFSKADAKRASKNFEGLTALMDAQAWKTKKGVGVVKEKPQMVKACDYCLGRYACNQYQILKSQGLIDDED